MHGRSDQDRDLDEPVHEHGIRESIYRLVLSLEAVFWHDIHTHQNEKFRNHGDEAKSERKIKSESYICFTNSALIVGCVNLGGVKANQDQVQDQRKGVEQEEAIGARLLPRLGLTLIDALLDLNSLVSR